MRASPSITGLGVGAALLAGAEPGTDPGELTWWSPRASPWSRPEVVRSRPARHRRRGDRVGELLEHRRDHRAGPHSVGALRGEVVYSALSAQGRRGPLFDGVSLVIPAGQHVALVGRDGDEASALLSYLLRFDQPDSGRVLLDRYDTRELSLADLRRGLAVVQRESALFSESVRENIRVGRRVPRRRDRRRRPAQRGR